MLEFLRKRAITHVDAVSVEDRTVSRTLSIEACGKQHKGWLIARFDEANHQVALQVSDSLSEPGTRSPSPRGKLPCSRALIACGSASRSKAARTRRITSGSTPLNESLTRSSTWQCSSSKLTVSHPSCRCPPASTARVRAS